MGKTKRKDGYIILDDFLMIENKNPIQQTAGHIPAAWFLKDNQEYFFKYINNEKKSYNEIFSSIIAKKVGIKSVTYDLASYNNLKGIVCENYNNNHEFEISLMNIVIYFYKNYMRNYPEDYPTILKDVNNLEIIWESLMFYFKDYDKKEEIIYRLMNDIVDAFILQCLLGNADANLTNITIINQENPQVVKNYDYGLAGVVVPNHYYKYSMEATFLRRENLKADDVIKNFLAVSTTNYLDYFKEKVQLLPDVEAIFREVEQLTEKEIPEDIKTDYASWYFENKESLQKILEDYSRKHKIL